MSQYRMKLYEFAYSVDLDDGEFIKEKLWQTPASSEMDAHIMLGVHIGNKSWSEGILKVNVIRFKRVV